MSFTINQLMIRTILNSCGMPAIEVEMCINERFTGIGSGPTAIKAGKREAGLSDVSVLANNDSYRQVIAALENKAFADQRAFDAYVEGLNEEHKLGSGLTLSLSIAFCRACAQANGRYLFEHISDISQSTINMPYPMANIFSGGIHSLDGGMPFQQMMIIPQYDSFAENVGVITSVYTAIEQQMQAGNRLAAYSASSGMLVTGYSVGELFDIVNSEIQRFASIEKVKLGIDVAAEHLHTPEGHYRFIDGAMIDGEALYRQYCDLVRSHNVFYVEDPFDSSDEGLWRRLTAETNGSALVVGDDLFATNPQHIHQGLAGGILLKMNQAGSIKRTIEAAHKAASLGMTLCVSHRSCETEDTTMCDLAVGLGARYIKIGGPRRGDRIGKYNQLIRIEERRKSASAACP